MKEKYLHARKKSRWIIPLVFLAAALLLLAFSSPKKAPDPEPVSEPVTLAYTLEDRTVTYGRLQVTLPEGYSSREENGSVALLKEDKKVGGITWWKTPDIPLTMPSGMAEWVKALGLPEAQEDQPEPIAYMISNSVYGDLQAEYFNELNPEKLNVEHVFLIADENVYDVFYDQNVISDTEAGTFLQTLLLDGIPQSRVNPEKDGALEKCREVLRTVQNGAYCIASQKHNIGTEALNESSQTISYRHGQNWLNMTTIPQRGKLDSTEVTDSKHAYMYVDGVYYSNEADGWDENGNVRWAEGRQVQVRVPWLATYPWSSGTLSYIGTLMEDGGECIQMRVNEPHPYGEGNDGHYFVNFYFDQDGNFIKIKKMVNLYQSSEYTEYESIESLAEDWIRQEIDKEYQRAIQ